MSDRHTLLWVAAIVVLLGVLIAAVTYPRADRAIARARLDHAVAPITGPVDGALPPHLDADGKGAPPAASRSFVDCQNPNGHQGRMPSYSYSFPFLVLGRQKTAGGYVNAAKRFVAYAARRWRAAGYTVTRSDVGGGARDERGDRISDLFRALATKHGIYLRAEADFSSGTVTLAGYGSCPSA